MSFSLHVPVPAIRGHFGRESLYTFQTQVRPEQIINLLGHDPRHDNWKKLPADLKQLYEKVQRKTTKNRRESVEGYLEDRLVTFQTPGGFPSLCIGMTNPPEFEPGDKRPVATGVVTGDIVLVPEGSYHIVSNYGDARATVRSDRTNCSAISRLLCPVARARNTSTSLGVRPSGRASLG